MLTVELLGFYCCHCVEMKATQRPTWQPTPTWHIAAKSTNHLIISRNVNRAHLLRMNSSYFLGSYAFLCVHGSVGFTFQTLYNLVSFISCDIKSFSYKPSTHFIWFMWFLLLHPGTFLSSSLTRLHTLVITCDTMLVILSLLVRVLCLKMYSVSMWLISIASASSPLLPCPNIQKGEKRAAAAQIFTLFSHICSPHSVCVKF